MSLYNDLLHAHTGCAVASNAAKNEEKVQNFDIQSTRTYPGTKSNPNGYSTYTVSQTTSQNSRHGFITMPGPRLQVAVPVRVDITANALPVDTLAALVGRPDIGRVLAVAVPEHDVEVHGAVLDELLPRDARVELVVAGVVGAAAVVVDVLRGVSDVSPADGQAAAGVLYPSTPRRRVSSSIYIHIKRQGIWGRGRVRFMMNEHCICRCPWYPSSGPYCTCRPRCPTSCRRSCRQTSGRPRARGPGSWTPWRSFHTRACRRPTRPSGTRWPQHRRPRGQPGCCRRRRGGGGRG